MKNPGTPLLFAGLMLLAVSMSSRADDYPARPVTMIVPYSAGSPIEVNGRKAAEQLQKIWNHPVVVENKPGAGATIGANYVAKAAPDGYTFLFGGAAVTAFKALFKNLPFDPIEDLAPVSQVLSFVSFVTVN